MAGTAPAPQEIESLYTTIGMEDKKFQEGAGRVSVAIDNLEKKISGFADSISKAVKGGFGEAAKSLAQIGKFLEGAAAIKVGQITELIQPLKQFSDGFKNATEKIQNVRAERTAVILKNIGSALTAMNAFSADEKKIGRIGDGINKLVLSIKMAIAGQMDMEGAAKLFGGIGKLLKEVDSFSGVRRMPGIGEKIKGMFTDIAGSITPTTGQQLGTVMSALQKINLFLYRVGEGESKGPRISALGGTISTLFTKISGITVNDGAMKAIGTVSLLISRIGAMTPATGGKLTGLVTPIKQFFDDMGAIGNSPTFAASAPVVKAINAYQSVFLRLGKQSPDKSLELAASATKKFMEQIGAIKITKNHEDVIRILNRFSTAMRRFNALGAGKGPPSPPGITATFFGPNRNPIGDGIERADRSGQQFLVTLERIYAALAGLGTGMAVRAFVEFDESVARSMVVTGDWSQTTRQYTSDVMRELRRTSILASDDITKAFQTFLQNGANPAMAAALMRTSDAFAVAANVTADRAAQLSMAGMRTAGMMGKTPEETLANQEKLMGMIYNARRLAGNVEKFDQGLTPDIFERGRLLEATPEMILSSLIKSTNSGMNVDFQTALRRRISMGKRGDLGERTIGGPTKIGLRTGDAEMEAQIMAGSEKMFAAQEIMYGTMAASVTLASRTFTDLAVSIGDVLAPAVKAASQAFSGLYDQFMQLNPAVRSLIVLTGIVAVLAVPAFWALQLGVQATMYAMSALLVPFTAVGYVAARSFDLMMYGINWVVAGFGTIFRTIGYLWKHMEDIKDGFISMAKAIAWPFQQVFAGITWMLKNLDTVIAGTVILIFSPLIAVVATLWGTIGGLGWLIKKAFDYGSIAGEAFTKISLNMVVNLTSGILTLITAFLAIGPILSLISVLFAGIAAIAVTIGIGIGQLAALVGGALVQAWNAFGNIAGEAFAAAGRGVQFLHQNAAVMWNDMKDGLGGFVVTARMALTSLAGFFWNWRDNMNAIWKFLGKYGEQAFIDIGDASFKMAEIIGGNFMRMVSFMAGAVWTSLSAVWGMISNSAQSVFTWVGGQWGNMLGDMLTLFIQFLSNINKNWGKLRPFIDSFVFEARDRFYAWEPFSSDERNQKKLDDISSKAAAVRVGMLPWLSKNLVGPFDGLAGGALKTDFGGLGDMLGVSGIGNSAIWKLAQKTMSSSFGTTLGGMLPMSGAFSDMAKSPIWHELIRSFNTVLPEGVGEQIKSMLGLSGITDGSPAGRGNAGFAFKQIAENRYMVGGEELQAMDIQQLQLAALRTLVKQGEAKLNQADGRNDQNATTYLNPYFIPAIGD